LLPCRPGAPDSESLAAVAAQQTGSSSSHGQPQDAASAVSGQQGWSAGTHLGQCGRATHPLLSSLREMAACWPRLSPMISAKTVAQLADVCNKWGGSLCPASSIMPAAAATARGGAAAAAVAVSTRFNYQSRTALTKYAKLSHKGQQDSRLLQLLLCNGSSCYLKQGLVHAPTPCDPASTISIKRSTQFGTQSGRPSCGM
jgi:hypothetical protein